MGIYERIKYILKDDNICLAPKPVFYLKPIFSKFKDKVPLLDTINTVYRIKCTDCHLVYIGTSSQRLSQRLKQHINDISRISKLPSQDRKPTTALCQHAIELNHTFDFDNVDILKRESVYHKRLLSEAFFITKYKQFAVNYNADLTFHPYLNLYNSVIKKHIIF